MAITLPNTSHLKQTAANTLEHYHKDIELADFLGNFLGNFLAGYNGELGLLV